MDKVILLLICLLLSSCATPPNKSISTTINVVPNEVCSEICTEAQNALIKEIKADKAKIAILEDQQKMLLWQIQISMILGNEYPEWLKNQLKGVDNE